MIAIGTDYIQSLGGNINNGHVEGSSTQIVDQDIAFFGMVILGESIGHGGGSGLIEYFQNIEAGNLPGRLGGFALLREK